MSASEHHVRTTEDPVTSYRLAEVQPEEQLSSKMDKRVHPSSSGGPGLWSPGGGTSRVKITPTLGPQQAGPSSLSAKPAEPESKSQLSEAGMRSRQRGQRPDDRTSDKKKRKRKLSRQSTRRDTWDQRNAQGTFMSVIREARMQNDKTHDLAHLSAAIMPDGAFKTRWDVTMIFMLIYTALFTPFQMAFLQEVCNIHDISSWLLIFVTDRIVDTFFIADMVINFRLAHVSPNGSVHFDSKKVAKEYLKSWFTLDLLSVLPYDMLPLLFSDKLQFTVRVPKLLRLVRLLKLLKVVRAMRIFKAWEQRIIMHVRYGVIRLCKLAVLTLFICHWMACFWFLVYTMEKDNTGTNNWVDAGTNGDRIYTLFDRYIVSMHWAVMTVTTIGYGDVYAVNTTERCFTVFSMLIGACVFAVVIGTACDLVGDLMSTTNSFQRRMDALGEYMTRFSFPATLRAKANRYCFYQFEATRGADDRMRLDAMEMLSPAMKEEVSLHIYGDVIRLVPPFSDSGNDFVSNIGVHVKELTYGPNEYVMRWGETTSRFYIMMQGRVQMETWNYKLQETFVIDTLQAPNYFNPEALLAPRRASFAVRTMGFCTLSYLTKEAFIYVLKDHPRMRKKYRRWAVLKLFRSTVRLMIKNGDIHKVPTLLEEFRMQQIAIADQERRRIEEELRADIQRNPQVRLIVSACSRIEVVAKAIQDSTGIDCGAESGGTLLSREQGVVETIASDISRTYFDAIGMARQHNESGAGPSLGSSEFERLRALEKLSAEQSAQLAAVGEQQQEMLRNQAALLDRLVALRI